MHYFSLLFLLFLPLLALAQQAPVIWRQPLFPNTANPVEDTAPIAPQEPAEEPFPYIDDRELFVHFPGGDTALGRYWREHLVYPDSLRDARVEGQVWVRFLIAEAGIFTGTCASVFP